MTTPTRELILPVLMKEMRSRMRGLRGPIILFITTGLAILAALIIIGLQWSDLGGDPQAAGMRMAEIGRSLFVGVTILELILCGLLAPSLTAGAITTERERQTLEFLLLTRLSGTNILLGKLISSLSFVIMVLLCALPVGAIAFVLGGVSPGQFIWSQLLIFAVMLLFGAFGAFVSTWSKKTGSAVVVTFGLCFIWLVGPASMINGFPWIYYTFKFGHDPEPAAYFLFTFLYAFMISLMPTLLVSAIGSVIRRRALPLLVSMLIWVGFCLATIFVAMRFPQELKDLIDNQPWLAGLGNPITTVSIIFLGEEHRLFGTATFYQTFFAPLSILLMLLAAWVVFVFAARQFDRLRQQK